ncbi:MAG: type II toxin-antitoxin system RelE/ParE family toxin [Candidatus Hydrogenedentes bacterium]|nr:type II toxin-antitoxin system RelE/ParE family toxin [Candidatus Hydrogenedentota bacterium]
MASSVRLTEAARRDLQEIYDFVAEHDAPSKTEHVLEQIEKVLTGLAESPERGAHPKELLALGIRGYRQLFFKPYRIIYKVTGNVTYVMVIADGRRDMQTLLQRRLLE